MHSELLEVAVSAAGLAGEILKAEYGRQQVVARQLPHDIKLALDRRCEEAIIGRIRDSFPLHGIVTEEAGIMPGRDGHVWYVDPLDGTVNFFHGLPHFCTSIACYHRMPGDLSCGPLGRPLIGAVYAPALDLLFCGGEKCEATVNARPMKDPELEDLSHAMVGLAFSNRHGGADALGRLASRLAESAQKVRSFGATALDICLVASGRLGAFIQRGTNSWDLAAGCAIAGAAGCTVHIGPHAEGRYRLVVTQPRLFPSIMDIVRTSTEEKWNAYDS